MLTVQFLITVIRRAIQMLEKGETQEALNLLKETVKDIELPTN
jgi:ribosomal protein S20